MSQWNKWVRQIHRWVSILFTLGVLANIVASIQDSYTMWVGLMALVPLIVLLFTGLYMFVLPYVAKRRVAPSAQNTRGVETR